MSDRAEATREQLLREARRQRGRIQARISATMDGRRHYVLAYGVLRLGLPLAALAFAAVALLAPGARPAGEWGPYPRLVAWAVALAAGGVIAGVLLGLATWPLLNRPRPAGRRAASRPAT